MNSKNIIVRAAIPTVVVGIMAVVVGYLKTGTQGLVGAAFGALIVVVFFSAGQLALDKVIRTNPGIATSMALLLYLIKVAVLFVLILIFQDTKAFDTKVFAATIVTCTIVWLVAETWAFATAKVLYVEPGSGPEIMPFDDGKPSNF